jgi:acid phosphatase
MNCYLHCLTITVTLLLGACSSQPPAPSTHESLNAGLWTQTAAEYAASTTQAYRVAMDNLDRALSDPHWSAALEQQGDFAGLPPAVLLDIDQTVLDNSGYNTQLILAGEQHTMERFTAWCEAFAPAIAGVKPFMDHAVARGVTVIYYSARPESLRDCTTRNLLEYALPLTDQALLLLNDATSATRKVQQRSDVAGRYRILLIVGDNLDDFVSGSKDEPAARRSLAKQHASRWGREWIILPNPVYGHWEASIYGFDRSLSRDERVDRKLQYLSD